SVCVVGGCALGACHTGFADCDGNPASGCEANLTTDPARCGACGTVCGFAHAGAGCAGGACTIGACSPGYGNCDGSSANGCETVISIDPGHCGACSTVCSPTQYANAGTVCLTGACSLGACAAGFANCDGNSANGCETNLVSDAGNCGRCGGVCALAHVSAVCTAGACAIGSCAAGWGNCDGLSATGCEASVVADASNCGACGVTCSPSLFPHAGAVCAGSACTLGACAAGYADCDGVAANGCEVNVAADPAHCGSCATVCAFAQAGATCAAGTCALGACAAGYGNCDGLAANGCETSVSADPSHCGSCATVCAFAQAGATCAAGTCALGTCAAGYGNCDGLAANGCESNLGADVSHCGSCATACTFAHAGATCASGACAMGACAAGYADCDGLAANGCETSVVNDASHCGTCATVCAFPQAAATCSAGACVMGACGPGYADCDGLVANGCETNPSADVNHCGTCSTVCSFPQATPSCVFGACALGACNPNFGSCDGIAANGCETDLRTSVANCGGCGTTCTAGVNAAVSCTAGACAQSCLPGYADCNGLAADGCEVSITTDLAHCGLCGTTCGPVTGAISSCAGGSCGFSCTGYALNCDGNAANGCETDGSTSITSCGACGVVCFGGPHATPACAPLGGTGPAQCTLACAAGWADCDGNPTNGCEVYLGSNPGHCGTCPTVCSGATPNCSAGVCSAACGSGLTTCTRACVNLQTDPSNCGSCARACTGGLVCSAGNCVAGVSCSTPLVACNGSCVNNQTDPANCGACNVVCGATAVCRTGECRTAGDSCSYPIALALTPGPMAFTINTSSYGDSGNSCSTGPDGFFSFTLAQRELVYVDSFATTGSAVARLMLFDSCGSLTASCASGSCSTTQSQTWAVLSAGTHLLEVDTPTAGLVRLTLQHIPLAMSGGLPSGTQLPASFALSGTTSAASSSAMSCGLGPDLGWFWVTCPGAAGGTLAATVCGASTYDTVLQLLNGNQIGGSCNNDACGLQSTLSAPVSSGAGVHVLYMDGAAVGNSGAFTVSGTRP
ncbi:MAG: hypothetical protein WCJ30_05565, partial [Deltaproteobacteria bacterium]